MSEINQHWIHSQPLKGPRVWRYRTGSLEAANLKAKEIESPASTQRHHAHAFIHTSIQLKHVLNTACIHNRFLIDTNVALEMLDLNAETGNIWASLSVHSYNTGCIMTIANINYCQHNGNREFCKAPTRRSIASRSRRTTVNSTSRLIAVHH